MKSPCLLSLIIILFLISGAGLGISAYLFWPVRQTQSPGFGPLDLWWYGTVVAIVGSAVCFAGSIMSFIYNCPDGMDWFRFLCGPITLAGAALCIAAAVLLGITLNDLIACGTTCTCQAGFCRLDYFTGAATGLSGLTVIFGFCCGLSTMLTT